MKVIPQVTKIYNPHRKFLPAPGDHGLSPWRMRQLLAGMSPHRGVD